jgi:hypothetical protein
MFYQVKIKRTVIDDKGNDRSVTEDYIVDQELFGESEMRGYQEFNGECDVVAIKRLPNLKEFVNERNDEVDVDLYLATLEDKFVNDDGEESSVKYNVIVYAQHINEANRLLDEYLKRYGKY